MSKLLPAAVLTVCLCLSGCASDPMDTAEAVQDAYRSAEKLTMTVSVSADYGEKVYGYKLRCTMTPEGGEIEIKEPAAVAGVKAVISDDGVTLCYDGAEVSTGAILPDGLSPVDAMPVMTGAWRGAPVTEAVRESFGGVPCTAPVFYINDGVSLRTWFEDETLLPVHAEISSGGFTVIFCDFENVVLE